MAMGLAGDHLGLGENKDVTMEQFCTWTKAEVIDGSGDIYLGLDRYSNFEKYLWFELVQSMWRKHWSTLKYHVKYISNDIVKPFRLVILHYDEHVREMYDLDKYLLPPLQKGWGCNHTYWNVCGKKTNEEKICVSTKEVPSTSMQE